MLRPDDTARVRLRVGDTDVPVYVEALRTRHADGSLRSVLVQTRGDHADGTPATLTIGPRRTAPDLPRPERPGVPVAAALPTSPDYLVSTGIVGPTATAAASAGAPGVAEWDAIWRGDAKWGGVPRHGPKGCDWHWKEEADAWGANFYDRAHSYLVMWARTGNPVYWHRGVRIAVGYRRGYVEQYNGATPHWTQALGLLRHYQLTGDDASRAALQLIWDKAGWWSVPEHLGAAKSTDVENRIRARMLQLQHVLWQLADTHAERARLAATLDASLAVVLGEQAADGRWPVQAAGNQPMPYMDGMLCDALIDLHDGYRADPRLVTVVRRTADDLWRRFRPAEGGMPYLEREVQPVGGTEVVPVLNALCVNALSWSHARGAGAVYRDRADAFLVGAVKGVTPTNGKEFNQLYNTAYKHLAYREGRTA
jgi:hypothetical protein